MGKMKPHKFSYWIYEPDGKLVRACMHKYDAELLTDGTERYYVRKDALGNYPDKKFE